jgi:hypothetical protein
MKNVAKNGYLEYLVEIEFFFFNLKGVLMRGGSTNEFWDIGDE